ncbi:MAG: hypothetical protein AB7I50_20870 [Vicinamibacterales bacterium]
MTARTEDEPRVLVFVDILGFEAITREIRVRVKDYPRDKHGFTGSGTTELQGRFVRFSTALDRHVFNEGFAGGIQAMLFSDCAFLVYDNSLRATIGASNLMRCLITRGVPVRMGLGKGTFYDMEYMTMTTAAESRVVSKSRFYGTAVVNAHAAESCGGKGMRIFLHQSLEEDLSFVRQRVRSMKLRRAFQGVRYELDYLYEKEPTGAEPSEDEKDRELFAKVALLKNPAWPKRVLRQYTETHAAMNRMRKEHGRKRVAAHGLPCNAPPGTIW